MQNRLRRSGNLFGMLGSSLGGSWTPRRLGAKILFWGKVSEIAGGEMPNKLGTDALTVGGTAGSYTFQCPNTTPYQNADTDYIWFQGDASRRTATEKELNSFDFAKTIVKYANISNYPNGRIAVYNGCTDGGVHADYAIGLAYTLDGITWSRDALNPIISKGAGGTWDETHVMHPRLIIVNDIMYVFYSGYSAGTAQVGLATSEDHGQTWTKYPLNPILTVGAGGAWDDSRAFNPNVLYDVEETDANKRWKMWYLGDDGLLLKVGYAYSADGKSWTKYGSNPVLLPGGVGAWDSKHTSPSCIKKIDTTYYLFYGGSDTDNYSQTGLATFTNPEGTYTKLALNPIVTSRKTSVQNLTANTLSGSPTIKVADSSVFEENEYVLIGDANSIPFLARVQSIDNSTTITLDRNVTADYTTAQSAFIESVYSGNVNIGSVYQEGNTWVALIALSGLLTTYASGYVREYVGYATASSIDGEYTFDFDRGLTLTPDAGSTWDQTSMENFTSNPLQWYPGTYASIFPISEIIILSEALTTTEMNKLRDYADLSIYWNGILSTYGNTKGNRLSGQSVWTSELDSRTVTLLVQMAALSETPTTARKNNINTTIKSLKGKNATLTNFFNKFDRLIFYRATGNGSRMLNIIQNTFNAEGVANGGILTQTNDVGVHSDGTKSYIRSHYVPSSDADKLKQNDACIGMKVSGTLLGVGFNECPVGCGIPTQSLCIFNGTAATYHRVNDLASGSVYYIVGYNNLSRSNATEWKQHRSGVGENTQASNSIGLPTTELFSLCFNNNGTPAFFTPNTETLEFEWQGAAITYTEFQTLMTILDAYIAAL